MLGIVHGMHVKPCSLFTLIFEVRHILANISVPLFVLILATYFVLITKNHRALLYNGLAHDFKERAIFSALTMNYRGSAMNDYRIDPFYPFD